MKKSNTINKEDILHVVAKECDTCNGHIGYHLATNHEIKTLSFTRMNSIERGREFPNELTGYVSKAVTKCTCKDCSAEFFGTMTNTNRKEVNHYGL